MEQGRLHDARFLIADPNEDSGKLTATLCHNIGVNEVQHARDTRELVAKLEHHRFDLMIITHRFPPKGAVHLAQLLQGTHRSPAPDMPVIILAGTITREEVMAVKALKHAMILLRPLSTQKFHDHVSRLTA